MTLFINSEEFRKLLDRYIDDPVLFVHEQLKASPDPWQEQVLRDVWHSPRVAVQSGHGVGKSAVLSWAVLAFIACHPFCKIPTTAPNFEKQVRGVLWAEIHKWFRRSPLLNEMFDITTTQIRHKIYKEEWFATGFSVEQSEQEGESKTMEGFHAPFMLAVIDEAKGVSDAVFESIRGALSGDNSHWLIASTPPLDPVGAFVNAVTKQRSLWKVTHVSALDSPRVSREQIELHKKEWGEDSALYQAKVLGIIPKSGSKSFYPPYLIEEAMNRPPSQVTLPAVLGVDLAWRGTDFSAFAMRRGFNFTDLERLPIHLDPGATVGAIIRKIREQRPQRVQIDMTGLGGPIMAQTQEMVQFLRTSTDPKDYCFREVEVIGVELGSSPSDLRRYRNLRAELYDALRLGMVERLISLPKHDILFEEMSDIFFKQDSLGRLLIESKEEMRSRGKASPDLLDSIIISLYNPPEEWKPMWGGLAYDWQGR